MQSDDSILVLTSRERDWWWSMQEVIPALEGVWTHIGQAGRNVRMLSIPLTPEVEQSLHTSPPRPKHIVITTVTAATERIALLLRQQLGIDAPMTIYLCGDSTEGFDSWGELADLLTERDLFIVSSEPDAAATRCCFPNAQVAAAPFPLVDQFKLNDGDSTPATARLAYVGRVSEQKNLHTLLLSLWIMRTWFGRGPDVTLDVYGGVDNHGSPNVGLTFADYGGYLECLVEQFGLQDVVTWHGFKSRDWLFDNVHLEPHILVTPSLHSDENFGTSVLASLANGHQVVATAWGGHLGFQESFDEQLTLVPVHRSTLGPVVDPVQLANGLLHAVDRRSTFAVTDTGLARAREAFSERAGADLMLELLDRPDRMPVPLARSAALRRIDEQRAAFGGGRRIYTGYEDPLLQIFFEAYGMNEALAFQEQVRYFLPPWVSHTAEAVRIDDPHRGRRSFDLDPEIAEPVEVALCPSMETRRLPKSLVEELAALGYAFVLPARSVRD